MDARMLTAGLAAGLLLIFLLPTFNALNNSYTTNVKPPPWVTPPSKYPDVTPPDITPPTNFQPPTNPPSKLPPPPKDGRIPPGVGGCPNPTVQWYNRTITSSGPSSFSADEPFSLTNRTVYLEGYVNVSSWTGSSVSYSLTGPDGFDGDAQTQPSSGALFGTSQPPVSWHYQSYNNQTGGKVPPPGRYNVNVGEGSPIFSGSRFDITFGALVCGGA